jgi:hypothetical protein
MGSESLGRISSGVAKFFGGQPDLTRRENVIWGVGALGCRPPRCSTGEPDQPRVRGRSTHWDERMAFAASAACSRSYCDSVVSVLVWLSALRGLPEETSACAVCVCDCVFVCVGVCGCWLSQAGRQAGSRRQAGRQAGRQAVCPSTRTPTDADAEAQCRNNSAPAHLCMMDGR